MIKLTFDYLPNCNGLSYHVGRLSIGEVSWAALYSAAPHTPTSAGVRVKILWRLLYGVIYYPVYWVRAR